MSFMFYVYLIASLIYIYIGIVTYVNDSSNKLNRMFLLICIDLALWALMFALLNAVPDAETATVFREIATLFWSTIYCMLLHFFMILIKKDNILKKSWALLLLYCPAIISIYLYYFYIPVTAEDLVKIKYSWAYINPVGKGLIWDNFFNLYYISYSFTSIFLLYFWGRRSKLKREKQQAKIIIITFIIVLILGSITDIILPILKIPILPPLTIFFILIPVCGIYYSIKKYRLMNLKPEHVVLEVMKTMREGLIITNHNGLILDINLGAMEMLGYKEKELMNRPIETVLQAKSFFKDLGANNTIEQILKTKDNEELPTLISYDTLFDVWGEPYGSVLIFQDLKEIKGIQHKLQESYERMETKVFERTKELYDTNEELKNEILIRTEMETEIKKMAYFDILTGLPNRRLFMEHLNLKIKECENKKNSFSIMFMDLDSFKMVNDTMGHEQGDILLKYAANRLLETVSPSDIIGRIGGDEFLILVNNIDDEEEKNAIADKIIKAFHKPFKLNDNEIYITTSLGVAMYPNDGEDVETLIKNADIAMYKAKEKGKNKYELCNAAMKTGLVEAMKLSNQLYRAIEKNELELYYQPQVDTNSFKIIGYEALIRWNNPKSGMVSPGEFIPIAEKTGLIIPIGEWVLWVACKQNKIWHDQGISSVPIAVNLSVKQFMDHNLVDKISRILLETGLEPKFLELEITESVLMQDVVLISKTLEQLNKLGVRISIDDFGTEYSSLNYIKQLPIDRIKIAMTFVRGISINKRDEAIINAIIALSNNLDIETIAEGVENHCQLEFLKAAKCNSIQGFYFYKPMTAANLEEVLSDSLMMA